SINDLGISVADLEAETFR
ncbi:hypothetical protein A2U01_0116020, partial [Trifolium medium]|nr:hypothetical protein [Trifolium medium]